MMSLPIIKRIGPTLLVLTLALVTGTGVAEGVVVVSARSPVTTLSRNQVVDIFLGRMTRFPDGTRAVPIDQAEGSATRDAFYLKFADKSPAQIKAYWSKIIFTGRGKPPPAVSNGAEVKRLLLANPEDIGYIDERLVDSTVRVLRIY